MAGEIKGATVVGFSACILATWRSALSKCDEWVGNLSAVYAAERKGWAPYDEYVGDVVAPNSSVFGSIVRKAVEKVNGEYVSCVGGNPSTVSPPGGPSVDVSVAVKAELSGPVSPQPSGVNSSVSVTFSPDSGSGGGCPLVPRVIFYKAPARYAVTSHTPRNSLGLVTITPDAPGYVKPPESTRYTGLRYVSGDVASVNLGGFQINGRMKMFDIEALEPEFSFPDPFVLPPSRIAPVNPSDYGATQASASPRVGFCGFFARPGELPVRIGWPFETFANGHVNGLKLEVSADAVGGVQPVTVPVGALTSGVVPFRVLGAYFGYATSTDYLGVTPVNMDVDLHYAGETTDTLHVTYNPWSMGAPDNFGDWEAGSEAGSEVDVLLGREVADVDAIDLEACIAGGVFIRPRLTNPHPSRSIRFRVNVAQVERESASGVWGYYLPGFSLLTENLAPGATSAKWFYISGEGVTTARPDNQLKLRLSVDTSVLLATPRTPSLPMLVEPVGYYGGSPVPANFLPYETILPLHYLTQTVGLKTAPARLPAGGISIVSGGFMASIRDNFPGGGTSGAMAFFGDSHLRDIAVEMGLPPSGLVTVQIADAKRQNQGEIAVFTVINGIDIAAGFMPAFQALLATPNWVNGASGGGATAEINAPSYPDGFGTFWGLVKVPGSDVWTADQIDRASEVNPLSPYVLNPVFDTIPTSLSLKLWST
jgi:hypothetical protein